MDRGDISPIELFQRKKQTTDPLPTKRGVCRRLQPTRKNRISSRSETLGLQRFKPLQRSLKPLPDA